MERWIDSEDYSILKESLDKDTFHKGTKPEFFYAPGSLCKVYEDDKGPVLFLRAVKVLRLDIQFLDNYDLERNREIMKNNFQSFASSCKEAGFSELVFNTSSPHLKRFCQKVLKFTQVEGDDLRYFL